MDYAKFLKDKKVTIVGPAPTIIGSKQGNYIDSHDIVVRINKALPVPEHLQEDIGKRTDILYNCLNTHPENGGPLNFSFLKKSIKWLCCPYPKISPFDKDIKKFEKLNVKIPFHVIDSDYYLEIANKIKTRPNSGIGAILDLLNHDIKSLYITGFTFFKGGYYSEYRDKNEKQVMERMRVGGNHDQEPQIELVRRLFETDNRLFGDQTLLDIIL